MDPVLSRGALWARRERLPLEDSHWITLLVNPIANRRRHILPLPQPLRAPMHTLSVQAAAGVGLEVIPHSLGASLRFHHDVNVVGPHVGGQQVQWRSLDRSSKEASTVSRRLLSIPYGG